MSRKSYKPEQVINLLRKIEVEIAYGRKRHKRPGRWGSVNRPTTAGGRNLAG